MVQTLKEYIKNKALGKGDYLSFSQCGEDSIIQFLVRNIGLKNPTYWDIGAHHPIKYSNTFKFYLSGSRGLLIEPNPDLAKLLEKKRKRDIVLNQGLANKNGKLIYYEMDNSTLNTFSYEEMLNYEKEGHRLISSKEVNVITPKECSTKYFGNQFPDMISVDVEGLDYEILHSFDLGNNIIPIVCVETISYSSTKHEKKNTELISYLESVGYMLFADTFINSIFVKKELWRHEPNTSH